MMLESLETIESYIDENGYERFRRIDVHFEVKERPGIFDIYIQGYRTYAWPKPWIEELDEKKTEHTVQCMLGHLNGKQSREVVDTMRALLNDSLRLQQQV